mgnify:CR=1 FL=1
MEVCGDDNYPTEEQAMTAEALCIVRELNDSYYNNLVYQEWIRGNELSTECAAEVVLRKYEAPDGVEGKVNIRVQSSNIIYDYMMGEVK